MKKIFWITLILCLTMPLCIYAIDGGDFDADKDGDVDGEDLSGFAQYFGKLLWYKDADGDGFSDGTQVWAESGPEDYYSANELITLFGDPDDGDPENPYVYESGYEIRNRDDVIALSGYKEVTLGLVINSGPGQECQYILSLKGLEALISVGDDLEIEDDTLMDLKGLGNLTSVGWGLSISNSKYLESLSGLDNLNSVHTHLFIRNNPALTSLSALGNLTSIGGGPIRGELRIESNMALTSLSGLDNITSVTLSIMIQSNSALTSIAELDNITNSGVNLYIINNDALTSLAGLNSITSVSRDLKIQDNDTLTSLAALGNLTSIGFEDPNGGDLHIEANMALTSLGLRSLCTVEGDFIIANNTNLCENLAEELKDQVLSCPTGGIGGIIFIQNNKNCIE